MRLTAWVWDKCTRAKFTMQHSYRNSSAMPQKGCLRGPRQPHVSWTGTLHANWQNMPSKAVCFVAWHVPLRGGKVKNPITHAIVYLGAWMIILFSFITFLLYPSSQGWCTWFFLSYYLYKSAVKLYELRNCQPYWAHIGIFYLESIVAACHKMAATEFGVTQNGHHI